MGKCEGCTCLSRYEAYTKMVEGKKIRHKTFDEDKYLFIDENGIIRAEDGCNFTEGWDIRQGKTWDCGWSVI